MARKGTKKNKKEQETDKSEFNEQDVELPEIAKRIDGNPRAYKVDRGGRPTKLNDLVQKKIIQYIKIGSYPHVACAAAGINNKTMTDWMKKGAQGFEKKLQKLNRYMRFLKAIDEAVAYSEIRDLARIDKAAEKTWAAAAWKLERSRQNRWGRSETVDMNHTIKTTEYVITIGESGQFNQEIIEVEARDETNSEVEITSATCGTNADDKKE